MPTNSMTTDALLAALPVPPGSERLDSLDEGVWQAVLRRRRMLRKAGFATQILTVLCIVSGSFYFAQTHGRDVLKVSTLQQALVEDFE